MFPRWRNAKARRQRVSLCRTSFRNHTSPRHVLRPRGCLKGCTFVASIPCTNGAPKVAHPRPPKLVQLDRFPFPKWERLACQITRPRPDRPPWVRADSSILWVCFEHRRTPGVPILGTPGVPIMSTEIVLTELSFLSLAAQFQGQFETRFLHRVRHALV